MRRLLLVVVQMWKEVNSQYSSWNQSSFDEIYYSQRQNKVYKNIYDNITFISVFYYKINFNILCSFKTVFNSILMSIKNNNIFDIHKSYRQKTKNTPYCMRQNKVYICVYTLCVFLFCDLFNYLVFGWFSFCFNNGI